MFVKCTLLQFRSVVYFLGFELWQVSADRFVLRFEVNKMKKIVAILIALSSIHGLAAPSGSLKAMLDTRITLLEYYELHLKIFSIERLATDEKTTWSTEDALYESVVMYDVSLDFAESKLRHSIGLQEAPTFATIDEAKASCKSLIERSSKILKIIMADSITPNGWGNSATNDDDFLPNVRSNSIIERTEF